MRRKPVLGQVGLGSWGPNLLRNFINSGLCEVRLVCDLKEENYRKLGFDEGPSFTSDSREIIDDPGIDAVVLATPSETHYPLGRDVLRSGKHLFVEKPFALSSREAKKLVDAAKASGRIVMVGHLLMYHPGVREAARLVHRGKVGRVFFIGIRRLNLGRLQNHCSVLWDLGPHDISIALEVVGGRPLHVVSTGQAYHQPGLPEVAFTTITFEDGVQAHLEESWLSPRRVRELVVVGEKGMLVLDELSSSLKFFRKSVRPRRRAGIGEFDYPDRGEETVEVPGEQPLEAECRHFIECVRKGREPLSGGEHGLEVLRVLEAADRSLRARGRPFPVRGRRST